MKVTGRSDITLNVETMRWLMLLFVLAQFLPDFILGCTSQYREELQYLDFYLGIQPENGGNLPVAGFAMKRYINDPSMLSCQFSEPCAWMNAPTDDLLDTSDFYLFFKKNIKLFPLQIQPGLPDPLRDTRFVLAGNTTTDAQSAVLVSAPIACQRTIGLLKFKYWLYNEAKIETLILKPATKRNRLRVILRPLTECFFFRTLNDYCQVEIPEINEPFRIGIRVHGLKNSALGSFGMITDIEYNADICFEPRLSTIFGTRAVPSLSDASYPISAADLSCTDYNATCRWSNSLSSSSSEWKIGWNRRKWVEIFGKESMPTGNFFYQYVDSVSKKPYSLLRSELIPCTSTVATFTFRYWLQSGTQVQVCTVTVSNVIVSCVYLSEIGVPGPISIDIDAPSDESFRIAFEMINFDVSTFGLVVIDDLQFTGLLCHEVTTPPSTTINPLLIKQLFSLKPYPNVLIDSIPTLNCDFNRKCPQWESDGHWSVGMVPTDKDSFALPSSIKDKVSVAVLNKSMATLQSRKVPCASKAMIFVAYFRTEKAELMVCIEKKCVNTKHEHSALNTKSKQNMDNFWFTFFGWLSMKVDRQKPFFIRLIAKSTGPGLVIIRKIETAGNWCPLLSLSQYACETISCTFSQSFCGYKTETDSRANILFTSDSKGTTANINKGPGLAVLRSPQFKLSRPVELQIKIYQSTFGSQTFLCGDDFSSLYDCQPILGPKIELPTTEEIILPLDQEAQNFTIVAVHDKFDEFGAAKFTILKIDLLDENRKLLC